MPPLAIPMAAHWLHAQKKKPELPKPIPTEFSLAELALKRSQITQNPKQSLDPKIPPLKSIIRRCFPQKPISEKIKTQEFSLLFLASKKASLRIRTQNLDLVHYALSKELPCLSSWHPLKLSPDLSLYIEVRETLEVFYTLRIATLDLLGIVQAEIQAKNTKNPLESTEGVVCDIVATVKYFEEVWCAVVARREWVEAAAFLVAKTGLRGELEGMLGVVRGVIAGIKRGKDDEEKEAIRRKAEQEEEEREYIRKNGRCLTSRMYLNDKPRDKET